MARSIRDAPSGRRLNVGAGESSISPGGVNVDLYRGAFVNCIATADALPFTDETFALVISQETLEHVRTPLDSVEEVHRVLVPGGFFYCQLPFILGYHPGPNDYWRFTVEGIRELVERCGFSVEEVGTTAGAASGLYYVLVEFVAVALSAVHPKLYTPVKGASALVLAPLRWLDPLLGRSTQAIRIAGGHYVIARKVGRA